MQIDEGTTFAEKKQQTGMRNIFFFQIKLKSRSLTVITVIFTTKHTLVEY